MNLIPQRFLIELQSFTKKERLFLILSMCIGFLIAFEYSITRPSSHALFLTTFSYQIIPFLWLATVPLNFLGVYFYNRFLPKVGPLKIWIITSLCVVLINSTAAGFLSLIPKFIFLQCMCKDIYILLMFKQMWSLIHTTIPSSKAKYLYGLIFSMGTIGSCLGSFVPTFFAVQIGSESLFFFTFPLYVLLMLIYRMIFTKDLVAEDILKKELVKSPSVSEGFSVITQNRMLLITLFLVVAMQLSSGFMEYRFNAYLEINILDKDLRTAYCGKLFGLTNTLSFFFQAVGSFLMIQMIGLKRLHFLIPLMLLGSLLCSWIVPSFMMVSISYVFLKAIDFSLFSVSREMLYIPFSLVDKFRAKAVIDVFAYRSAKALVSLGILGLQFVAGSYLLDITGYISALIFVGWMGVAYFMLHDPKAVTVA